MPGAVRGHDPEGEYTCLGEGPSSPSGQDRPQASRCHHKATAPIPGPFWTGTWRCGELGHLGSVSSGQCPQAKFRQGCTPEEWKHPTPRGLGLHCLGQ